MQGLSRVWGELCFFWRLHPQSHAIQLITKQSLPGFHTASAIGAIILPKLDSDYLDWTLRESTGEANASHGAVNLSVAEASTATFSSSNEGAFLPYCEDISGWKRLLAWHVGSMVRAANPQRLLSLRGFDMCDRTGCRLRRTCKGLALQTQQIHKVRSFISNNT